MPVVFYTTRTGREVVREWLRRLEQPDRKAIGLDLMRAQYRWPVGMPLCRPLGGGLWELRTDLPSSRTARVLLGVEGERIIVLHGFVKKTQQSPVRDLALARRRLLEFQEDADR